MFCNKCGKQLAENETVCPDCEANAKTTQTETVVENTQPKEKTCKPDGLGLAAQILTILSCGVNILLAISVSWFYLISLAWMIPISICVANKLKFYEPVGTGLKICTLLFVNTLAGIFLFCRKEQK